MTEQTPDFLLNEQPEVLEDALEKLSTMVASFLEYEKQIAELEGQLKAKKELHNKLGMIDIPQLLLSHNLSRIRIANGREVSIKEDVSVTIEDDDGFFAFLENRAESDIIKLHFDFARMENELVEKLFDFLNEQDYEYASKKEVNAQTRAKYFRDLLGIGEEKEVLAAGRKMGKFLTADDVKAFAKVFPFYRTKVK
jgi:hypothetical protein